MLTVPLMVRGVKTAFAEHDHPAALVPANAATVMTHLAVAVLLAVGLIVDKLLH